MIIYEIIMNQFIKTAILMVLLKVKKINYERVINNESKLINNYLFYNL